MLHQRKKINKKSNIFDATDLMTKDDLNLNGYAVSTEIWILVDHVGQICTGSGFRVSLNIGTRHRNKLNIKLVKMAWY